MQRALAVIAGYTSTMEEWWREPGETEGDISDTYRFLYREVTTYLEDKDGILKKMLTRSVFSKVCKQQGRVELL